jgi:UDP-glucose 4-epimerase
MSCLKSYGFQINAHGLIFKFILRILITGGLGYLGERLSSFLSKQGHKIFAASRNYNQDYKFLNNVSLCQIDWSSDSSINQACQNCDVIIHTAGMNSYECEANPESALKFNGDTTSRLLKIAISCNVGKFIYFSTAHVYSDNLLGFFDESSITKNKHPYATSHKAGEDAVLESSKKGEINGVVLRISNSFGAPINPDTNCWSLLVNDLCRQAITLNKIILQTSGQQYRNFIAIKDLCRNVEFFVTYIPRDYSISTPIYNIGSKYTMSVYEMAKLISFYFQELYKVQIPIERTFTESKHKQNKKSLVYSIEKLNSIQGVTHDNLKAEILYLFKFCKIHFRN